MTSIGAVTIRDKVVSVQPVLHGRPSKDGIADQVGGSREVSKSTPSASTATQVAKIDQQM